MVKVMDMGLGRGQPLYFRKFSDPALPSPMALLPWLWASYYPFLLLQYIYFMHVRRAGLVRMCCRVRIGCYGTPACWRHLTD